MLIYLKKIPKKDKNEEKRHLSFICAAVDDYLITLRKDVGCGDVQHKTEVQKRQHPLQR